MKKVTTVKAYRPRDIVTHEEWVQALGDLETLGMINVLSVDYVGAQPGMVPHYVASISWRAGEEQARRTA